MITNKVWPSPPRIFLVLFLYSVSCRPGALSCRNPQPGGRLGHTQRPPEPVSEDTHISCLPFGACPPSEGGHLLAL